MRMHRGLAVLSLLTVSLATGVGSVGAQTDLGEAERRADQARGDADAAYAVVDAAVADRDAVEAQLIAILDQYADAAAALADANHSLDRVARSMAFADAQTLDVERDLAQQAVAAYMDSVTASGGIVFEIDTLEQALFAGEVLGRSQQQALGELDRLLVQRRELGDLQQLYAVERDAVSELQRSLDERSSELEEIFAQANAEVAAAYAQAAAADARYRQAQSDVDRARAAEEAARRTTTTSPGSGNTTTTIRTKPRVKVGVAVEAWRPLVTLYFAADLVEDAMVIMQCESLGDPDAVNPYSGASGLFQFMPGTWAVASVRAGVSDRSVFDGEANIIAASWLAEYYRSRGLDPWRPWTCRHYL